MSGLSARKEEFVYRPVSLMAVLSLVASLFSLFSFVSMFVIPIAFIFLIASIITYVRLERARNEYAGQLLAGLAIFISLIGTLGAGTVHAVTFFALSAEASAGRRVLAGITQRQTGRCVSNANGPTIPGVGRRRHQ